MAEKTEDATPKKLRDARRRGEVPKSRDLGTAATVLAVAGAFAATGGSARDTLRGLVDSSLRAATAPSCPPPAAGALDAAFAQGLLAVLPIVLTALTVGTTVAFLQVGPLLTSKTIEPKLERLDPIKGLRNLFRQRQLVELLKTLTKLLLIGGLTVAVLRESVRGVAGLTGRDAGAALEGTGALVLRLFVRVGGALLALGVADLLYQRWRHGRDQRMTKDEVKREYKDAEGDPQAKQARDRAYREVVEHDAVEAVRGADVLVVNPTHLAVALRYDEDADEAPEVVAKGSEHLARRMIEAAEEAGVPVMRDVPLARALHGLSRGEEIPERLYDAVALVLRAAWDERQRQARGEAGDEVGAASGTEAGP
ncbi:MAG: EscU/YscU/HrcU family type III secretion system export apparatus switch protein [Myxococcota bacterium]